MSDPNRIFARLVRAIMRDTLYHAQYICTVQSQDADGNLDLLPDDERIRGTGLSRVPIRYGIPGVTARVVAGARVTLAFEAGDPSRPFAALWDPGVIEEIVTQAPFLSRVVVVGVCMEPDTFRPAMASNKEIELRFSFCYDPAEFRETLHLVARGKVDPRPLVTDTVGLAGVAGAFEALGRPDTHAKILIDPSRAS